jgi:shikimate kinase
MIQLVGPGGAGKSTAGVALAQRLGVPFVDLDAEFAAKHGDISVYLDTHRYEAYAERNVSLYSALVGAGRPAVVALSSGFMTYRADIHPEYARCRQRIASSTSTVVLLPSLDLETCVAEIVRRQLRRRFARTAEREEHVIRTRFPVYASLPAPKVETMRPADAVVAELLAVPNRVRVHAPLGGTPRPPIEQLGRPWLTAVSSVGRSQLRQLPGTNRNLREGRYCGFAKGEQWAG